MLIRPRSLLLFAGAGALLALPAAGLADHKGTSHGQGKSQGESKRCAKTPKVGFVVVGTLVSFTADNPETEENEGTVTITVTEANGHATKSGEIPDQDAGTEGTQVAGATYTVPASDAHKQVLEGYEAPDTPSVGDAVTVIGKVERTKKKCAAEGTSVEDRYATPDIRKVVLIDADPDV